MKKLFLVDAYALIYRSYYAFLSRPMRNSRGMNTSAIFGFVKFLREIVAREHPNYMGVAFDAKGGNFRYDLYEKYKANRSETPEDITASVPYIKRILEAMRIPVLEAAGFEADDVIGTLARKAAAECYRVYMVTPDKDFGQLVDDTIFIYRQNKNGEGVEILGPNEIMERYGIADPRHVADILAIWGDASDNIPGAHGIGEKGALKLVGEFGTVDNLLAHIDEVPGKMGEKIAASRDMIMLSKELATIRTDVPIEFSPDSLVMREPDPEALAKVYRELDFSMFMRGLEVRAAMVESSSPSNDTSVPVNDDTLGKSKSPRSSVKPHLHGQGSLFGGDDSFGQGGDDNGAGDSATDGAQAAAAGHPHAQTSASADNYAEEHFHTAATVPHEYVTLTEKTDIERLAAEIKARGQMAFDTETTGFDIFNDRIVGVSVALEAHKAYYIPMERDYARLEPLREVLDSERIEKVGQNIKFDIMVLSNAGFRVRGFKYDTMILHYLLDAESRHNMNHLARTYLGYSPIEIESLIGRGSKQITMDMVPVPKVAEYCAEDSDVTLQLKQILWPMVERERLEKLYRTVEEPLIDVLVAIEMAGVKIDTEFLAQYAVTLNAKLSALEVEVRGLAGEPSLNINSPRQLGEVLFAKMKIDPKPKMTRTKQYSTDEESLQLLAGRHPIVGKVLEYRGVKILLSTYVEALPQLVNRKTGKVHTSFNQAVTSTGRLSSTNPNLQNIPIRDDLGREIRKAFIPSDSDHVLLSADYSQVELRLMAELSGDHGLIEAFERGEDIHAATASKIFGVALKDVTPEQRRRAKTANFGIIYGISAFGLSQRLNIPRAEAAGVIEGYFASYPGVRRYMEEMIAHAREQGFVTTLFGRKRYLPDISSRNANVRGLAERNAINTPLQGSAADIMKLAMVEVYRRFEREGIRSKVILQVHDELVVDTLRSEQEQVARIVTEAMEGAAKLKVALVVEIGAGESWLEAH